MRAWLKRYVGCRALRGLTRHFKRLGFGMRASADRGMARGKKLPASGNDGASYWWIGSGSPFGAPGFGKSNPHPPTIIGERWPGRWVSH